MQNIKVFFRKHWSTILMLAVVLVLIVSPASKAWVLRQFMKSGLLNAEIPATSAKGETADVNLAFRDAGGQVLQTKDLRGKILFINFWADWCPPCKAEMPSINALYEELKPDDRFLFIMVNADGDLNKAAQYMKQKKFNMPVYTPAGSLPPEIYSGTLPTTVIFDSEGRLVMQQEGIADYHSKDFVKKMREL